MQFILQFLYFSIALIIGYVAGSFGVIQLLIILFFSIPTTIKLKKEGAFKENTPLASDLISLCVILIIFLVVSFIFVKFFAYYQIAYWIGVGFVVLMGLGQIGGNANNLSGYLSNNEKYFTPEYLHRLKETKNV